MGGHGVCGGVHGLLRIILELFLLDLNCYFFIWLGLIRPGERENELRTAFLKLVLFPTKWK